MGFGISKKATARVVQEIDKFLKRHT